MGSIWAFFLGIIILVWVAVNYAQWLSGFIKNKLPVVDKWFDEIGISMFVIIILFVTWSAGWWEACFRASGTN